MFGDILAAGCHTREEALGVQRIEERIDWAPMKRAALNTEGVGEFEPRVTTLGKWRERNCNPERVGHRAPSDCGQIRSGEHFQCCPALQLLSQGAYAKPSF